MINRFADNPIITTKDIKPSREDWIVECVLNPGVFRFQDKTWLLLRVAERPKQEPGYISLPIYTPEGVTQIIKFKNDDKSWDTSDPRKFENESGTFLSTISHLRLVCSDDGIHFHPPKNIPDIIKSSGLYETYGIEDCRVSMLEGQYHLTYTQVSEYGVGIGLRITKDWINFTTHDMMFMPHNKDCALFEEKINGLYYAISRPSGAGLGGNFMWVSSSPDLIHWGNHQCIMRTRPGKWDQQRIGAGTSPVKTEKGWLEIYHGADAQSRYCLGAVLLALDDPSKVIARSDEPIMQPKAQYELEGFFNNVIFTNGHLVDGDTITMYYGASDEVICGAVFSISDILESLKIPSFA